VVLAHRVELDVSYEHHIVVLLLEHRVADHVVYVHRISAREPSERIGDALRRAEQTLARRILAEQLELSLDNFLQCELAGIRTNRRNVSWSKAM